MRLCHRAEKYIMEMAKKSEGTSRDREVEVLVAEIIGDEEMLDTIEEYKEWKFIALDDEGSSEDRDAEETEGEGVERVAKEGMVPLSALREAEEGLKAREEQFSRETELWEQRLEGSQKDAERKYKKLKKKKDVEGGSGDVEGEDGGFRRKNSGRGG